uniref:Uncharacterized protein n=1 Tax=Coprothermobacter proteolyticus (strain ATCC 35245 / DSM 5265 / OCM 4 / BT) TaxID=309798 RepID=B5Y7P9_COPPD
MTGGTVWTKNFLKGLVFFIKEWEDEKSIGDWWRRIYR